MTEDIRKITLKRFEVQITNDKNSHFHLANEVAIEKVIDSYGIPKEDYWDTLPLDETRGIFDRGIVNPQLKVLWFMACQQDNLALYQFILKGMGWKKGSELTQAYNAQSSYLQEFKPKNIAQWIVQNNKDQCALISTIGSELLEIVQDDKKMVYQLIKNSSFRTNSEKIYQVLRNTDNFNIFDKIMAKHLKDFNSKNSTILSSGHEAQELKFYQKIKMFFDKQCPDYQQDILSKWQINFPMFKEFIEKSELQTKLVEQLEGKDQSKKMKI